MKYNTYAAILVMTDANKEKRRFKKWLINGVKNIHVNKQWCEKECVFGGVVKYRPCNNIRIFNAAHVPGSFDYIIDLLCPNISTLEQFVNECLRYSSDISDTIKDTYTYIGIPIADKELPIYHKNCIGNIEFYDRKIDHKDGREKDINLKIYGRWPDFPQKERRALKIDINGRLFIAIEEKEFTERINGNSSLN